jgi:ferredoxin
MKSEIEKTFYSDIYIAGDLHTIRDVCREYCMCGLCVTVTPTEFIYKGGVESGAIVGIKQYPRFPKDENELSDTAEDLAYVLINECHQRSCMVVEQDYTQWYYKEN